MGGRGDLAALLTGDRAIDGASALRLHSPMSTEGGLLRKYYDMLMESQFWPADALRDHQRSQLGQLLRHAKKNAPFYETRLDAVLKPNGDIDWDRWREVPIVTREDLVKHREAMLATNAPPGHGQAEDYTTSGSTGVPITVRANGIATLAGRAAEYRAFNWHEIDFSQVLGLIVDDPAAARWPEGQRGGPWGPSWAYGTSAGRTAAISMFDSYEHMLDFIQRSEAQYLITGSTTAYALALEAERLNLDLQLDKLFTTGSTPTEPEREALARIFGAKLLQRYASKEANAIGHSCPTGDRFHVHAENILVEVLRPDGEPCQPGETGTVVGCGSGTRWRIGGSERSGASAGAAGSAGAAAPGRANSSSSVTTPSATATHSPSSTSVSASVRVTGPMAMRLQRLTTAVAVRPAGSAISPTRCHSGRPAPSAASHQIATR
jgi:hypothetical protein